MADKKISQLTVSTPTTGAILPIIQGGSTVAATLRAVYELLYASPGLSKNITGAFAVSGHMGVTGNLEVSGNTFLGNDPNDFTRVVGRFIQSGSSTISGSVAMTGHLEVTGNLKLGTFSGNAHTISGTVTQHGTGFLHGQLHVYRDSTFYSGLTVLGQLDLGTSNAGQTHQLRGPLNATGPFTIETDVTAEGALQGDTLSVTNEAIVGGQLDARGNVILGNAITDLTLVRSRFIDSGLAYFMDQVFTNTTVTMSGDLVALANTTLGNAATDRITLSGVLLANTQANFFGDLNTTGVNIFSGDTFLRRRLSVLDTLTVGTTFRTSGDTFHGTSVANTHSFQGDVALSRHLRVTGDVTATGAMSVAGPIRDYSTRMIIFSGVSEPQTSAATAAGSTVTFNLTDHGVSVGDKVFVSGATNSALYNGHFVVTATPNANSFTYTVGGSPPSPVVGTYTLHTVFKQSQCRGVSTVYRISEGFYEVAYTVPFDDENYMVSILPGRTSGGTTIVPSLQHGQHLPSRIRFLTMRASDGTAFDSPRVFVKCERI